MVWRELIAGPVLLNFIFVIHFAVSAAPQSSCFLTGFLLPGSVVQFGLAIE